MRMEIDVKKLSRENRLGPIKWILDQPNVAKREEIMDSFWSLLQILSPQAISKTGVLETYILVIKMDK